MNGERPISTERMPIRRRETWFRPSYFFLGIAAAVLASAVSLFLAAGTENESPLRKPAGAVDGPGDPALLLEREFAIFERAREECRKRLARAGEDPEETGSLPAVLGRADWEALTRAGSVTEEAETASLTFDEYEDPSGFFTVPYPAGWLVERAGDYRSERIIFSHPTVEGYSIEVGSSSVLHNPRDPDYYPSFPSEAFSKAERLVVSDGLDGLILETEGTPLATLLLVACGRKLRFDLFPPPSRADEAMGIFRELIRRLEVGRLIPFRSSPAPPDLDYSHPCGTFSLTLTEGWRIESEFPSGALFKNGREASIEISTLDPELLDRERFGENGPSEEGEIIDRGRLLINGMSGLFVTSRVSTKPDARISFSFFFEKGDFLLVGELDAPEPVYRGTLISSFSAILDSLE